MISSLTSFPSQNVAKTLLDTARILAGTRNSVSTESRGTTAKENEAYWSITTLAQSAVGATTASSALGVQTAPRGLDMTSIEAVYSSINDSKDQLDQIKIKALQVQEKLSAQALPIANNSIQSIMRLSQ